MIAQAAKAAGEIAVKYGPKVYDMTKEALAKATNGKVTDPTQIASYVGNNAARFSVVAGALTTAGVAPSAIIPDDLAGQNPQLKQIRATIGKIAAGMRDVYDAGSDQSLVSGPDDTAKDVLRKQRVEAVLNVYGSADQYFLCHPKGGIPRSDFAWYKAMGFARSGRI